MIHFNKEYISGVYAENKTIERVWHGTDLVWEGVRSCFGAGYWIPQKPWLIDDRWKYWNVKRHAIIWDDIDNLDVPWVDYSGRSVERFIKSELSDRIGYMYLQRATNNDCAYLMGFYDENHYTRWCEHEQGVKPLFQTLLPDSSAFTVSLDASMYVDSSTTYEYGDHITMHARCQYRVQNNSTSENSLHNADFDIIITDDEGFFKVINNSELDSSGNINIENILRNRSHADYKAYMYDRITGLTSGYYYFEIHIDFTDASLNVLATKATPLRDHSEIPMYISGKCDKTIYIGVEYGYHELRVLDGIDVGSDEYLDEPFIARFDFPFPQRSEPFKIHVSLCETDYTDTGYMVYGYTNPLDEWSDTLYYMRDEDTIGYMAFDKLDYCWDDRYNLFYNFAWYGADNTDITFKVVSNSNNNRVYWSDQKTCMQNTIYRIDGTPSATSSTSGFLYADYLIEIDGVNYKLAEKIWLYAGNDIRPYPVPYPY